MMSASLPMPTPYTTDRDDFIFVWLLDGDPAIRWQTRRDLLGEPPEAYESDRGYVASEGWRARC